MNVPLANARATALLGLLLLGNPVPGRADPGLARLRLRAFQPGLAAPVAVRAIVLQSNGEVIPGEWGDSVWPPVSLRGRAVTPATVLEVPPGVTTLRIGKGPDYLPLTIVTNLAEPGRTYTIECRLEPVLDLFQKGWRAGDAHIHFFHGDGQIFRTPEEAYAICAAGGLNFASLAGEHFGAPNLTRGEETRVWRAYRDTDCDLWLGAESPKNAWGHHASILYDPWAVRDSLPYQYGIHSVHRQGGVCFPVHPDRRFPSRSFNGDYTLFPLNNHLKFFPVTALAGHLLDGWSGVSDEPGNRQLLDPYFKLLDMGYRIPLLTDSDFCMDRVNNGPKGVGFWLNYFYLDGQPLTRAAVIGAIRQGRVMSTTGPLVLFTIDGALPGAILPPGARERTLRIEASHAFSPWTLAPDTFDQSAPCEIALIELIRNGQVVRSWEPHAPRATIAEPLVETGEGAWYMVRVLGNEGVWMAGYASPIYFSSAPNPPRQPGVFKMLVNGRLYDAAGGASLTGRVSCVRYGVTNWTVPTDAAGRFRAKVPLDADLVATDAAGRSLSRNLLQHEPAYAFCHYLPEHFSNKAEAIGPFRELVSEVTWEFPVGFQLAGSYVKQELRGDLPIEDLVVLSAPERRAEKDHAEIVMLFADKTQVQPGALIHYSVLWRAPAGGPDDSGVSIACFAWDPRHPRIYTRYGTLLEPELRRNSVPVGDGFHLLSGSVRAPDWLANSTATTGALRISAAVRRGGAALEDANLTIPAGPTRRALLVSTMWDGIPATWGDSGHGPCGFFRESFKARYPDYRGISVRIKHGAERIRIEPKADTAHAPDADDALFTDQHYYDAQCEPEYRNVDFRDRPRPQPPAPDFSGVAIADPPDATPPHIALMEPLPGAKLTGPVSFYYHIGDAGLSGPGAAKLWIDGEPSGGIAANPATLALPSGAHTWQVEGTDRAGNTAWSERRSFQVLAARTNEPPRFLAPKLEGNTLRLPVATVPDRNYLLERSAGRADWRLILRTNAGGDSIEIADPVATNRAVIYRLRETEAVPEN